MQHVTKIRFSLASITLAITLAAGAAWAQPDIIAARKDGLKRMQTSIEAIKAVVDARGDVRPLLSRVEDMEQFFATFPDRFPAGSGTGDTRARPTIWSDRAGFEQASATTLAGVRTLRIAVAAGDASATSNAFQALGNSCGACHRGYRAR